MTNAEQLLSTRFQVETHSTSELWQATHEALCAQQWSKARALLDDLAERRDVVDELSSAASYGLTGFYHDCIQDRIDEVNYLARIAK